MGEFSIENQRLVCFKCKRKVDAIKINKRTGYKGYCTPCYEKLTEVNEVYIVLCRDWLTIEPEVFRTEEEAKAFIRKVMEQWPDFYKDHDFRIFEKGLDKDE